MTLHTARLYSTRTKLIARILCAVCAYTVALLIYPTLFIIIGLVCLIWYGGYEVIGAALLLDALLAPGGGMLGEYHYTVLFLVAGSATAWIRRSLFTAQK